MADLDRLKVVFTADTQELIRSMERAQQSVAQSMANINRTTQQAAQGQQQLAQATQMMQGALRTAAQAAAAFGVAIAGMKMTEIIKDSTLSAARFETMGVVLGRLAANTNYSQKQIEQFAVGVQGMGITMTGSREVIARMIQGQMDLTSATRLARVAQDAATIGAVSSSEALERMVYAIQSAQPEMLRALGLNVNFEQSYQRMAAGLNKSVEALTEAEKVQARQNATMQAGVAIAGAYESAMGTAGKQLTSMERLVGDLQTKIGAAFLPAFTEGVKGVSQALATINTALESDTGQAALEGIGEAFRKAALASQDLIVPISVGLGVTFVGAALNAARAIGVVSLASTALSTAFAGWLLPIAGATTVLTYFLTSQNSAVAGAQRIADVLARETALRTGAAAATDRQTAAQERLIAARERSMTRGLERELTDIRGEFDAAQKNLLSFIKSAAFERITPPAGRFGTEALSGPASGDRSLGFAQYVKALQDFATSAAPANEAIEQLAQRLKALDDAQKAAGQSAQFQRADLRAWVQSIRDGAPAIDALTKRIEGLKELMKTPNTAPFDLTGAQQQIRSALDGLGLTQLGSEIMPGGLAKALGLDSALRSQLDNLQAGLARIQDQAGKLTPNTSAWQDKMMQAKDVADQIDTLIRGWPAIMRSIADATESSFTKALRDADRAVALAGIQNPVQRAGVQAGFTREDLLRDPAFLPNNSEAVRAALANRIAMQGVAAAAKDYGASMGDATRQAEIQANFARIIAEAEADGAFAVRQAQAAMDRMLAASTGNGNAAAAAAKAREAEATALGQAVAHARILSREASQGIAMSLALLKGPEAAAALARQQERDRLTRLVGPGQTGAIGQGVAAFDAQQAAAAASAMSQIGVEAQKAAAIARVEMGYIGASNSERERAVALEQLRLQYVEAIAKAGDNEDLKEQLGSINAQAEASINALAGVKAQLERTQQIQDAMKQAGDAIGSAFEAAILKGDKLTDVLKSLEQTLLQIFAKQFIFKPLTDMLGNFGSSILGSFFSGADKSLVKSAQGNVFAGGALSSYRNSFVTQPTVFPFAKGGAVGLMGEAGTEAIFPVIRTRSGDLGVRAVNDNGGGGGGNVNVNVYAPPGSEVREERRERGGSIDIDVIIDNAMAKNLGRAGTRSARVLRNNYGASPVMVRR